PARRRRAVLRRRCFSPRTRRAAEAERLGEAQVYVEEGRAGAEVARDERLPLCRVRVERAEASEADAGLRQVCGERGALRETRVAVRVAPRDDVEGDARTRSN